MHSLNRISGHDRNRWFAGMAFVVFALLLAIPASAADEALFATVHRLRGEVRAGATAESERPLRIGDRVLIGEKVRATSTSEAVLKTLDAGMVAVRPGAEFVVQGFTAKGDSADNMALKLLTGSLRVITGWIGRSNPSAHRIITPSATIGIRGTDHEPYVLTSDIPTADPQAPYRAGTYDKVNRGGTTLVASGQNLDIDPGKVGFVRAEAKAHRSRAIMTLLLPVLLDKIPDFYVPGEFDAELDRFSETADALAQKELEQKLQPAPTPAPESAVTTPPVSAPMSAPASVPVLARCVPASVAKAWVNALDDGIVRKDASSILGLFAPEVTVKAVVRKKDGSLIEVEFNRDELVRSTLATVNQLADYQHRRISIEAKKDGGKGRSCDRLHVKSVVIEQGKLSGKPYRFESLENYILEPRDGKWLAVKAESTQR